MLEGFRGGDGAIGLAFAHGGHSVVQRALCLPPLCDLLTDGVAGWLTRFHGVIPFAAIDDIGRRALKEFAQGAAKRLLNARVIESVDHVLHPCRPFLTLNLEAKMRFPEAQPPAALRINARAIEELN